MNSLGFPYLSLAIGSLLFAALRVPRIQRQRAAAVATCGVAGLLVAGALVEVEQASGQMRSDPFIPWIGLDPVSGWLMLALCLMPLFAVCLAPRRDVTSGVVAGCLVLGAANLLAYGSLSPWTAVLAWWLSATPFWLGRDAMAGVGRAWTVPIIGSALLFTLAMVTAGLVGSDSPTLHGGVAVLVLLAVALRKGLFPFHGWLAATFEEAPLLWLMLLFNGHLGGLLVLRQGVSNWGWPHWWVDLACGLVIVSSVVCSLRSLVEANPRRLFAYLFVGQSGLVVGGVLVANAEGLTGAMMHWLVVVVAASGLIAILRLLETRISGEDWWRHRQGLGVGAPRLATLFLLFALTLAGLPGTLGYCSQELLFNGATEHSFYLGLTLTLTSALNAISVFRIFSTLFLGVSPKNALRIPDLLPRERWPLAVCIVILLLGGLFPRQVIEMSSSEVALTEHATPPAAR
ncbi:MAG: hypothetical protein KIT22_03940 [Verrucomicrobiae bacterium]|nr:hypothetical protein [Verrucomicrobiae bacterium]